MRFLLPVVVGAVLAGCQPSSSVEGTLDQSARAVLVLTRPAPAGYLEAMGPATRLRMEAEGFVFRSEEVDYPPRPLAGYFLKLGERFIPIDRDGVFSVPADVPVAPALLYISPTELPLIVLDIAPALSSSGSSLRTVVYPLRGKPLASAAVMDHGDSFGHPASHAHGGHPDPSALVEDGCVRKACRVGENVAPDRDHPEIGGCCDDFDHTKGRIYSEENTSSLPSPTCAGRRVNEFWGTVCQHWVAETVCILEGAVIPGMPGCFARHKYRFCQFLDPDDYEVDGPNAPTVLVGGEISWAVSNGTPANETYITFGGGAGGKIVATPDIRVNPAVMGNAGAWVQHYDDAQEKHVRTRTVTYRAPDSLRAGESEAFDYLSFNFWGVRRQITVRVVQKQCGSGATKIDGTAACAE